MKASKLYYRWRLAATILFLLALPLAACTPATQTPSSAPTLVTFATTAPNNGSGLSQAGPAAPTPTPIVIKLDGAKTTASGLQYLEEQAGQGAQPKKGDLVTMNFIATLPDGTELQNTYKEGKPVSSIWGDNRLLPGWEEGIGLMKVGTKAKMVLPPALAFGAQGSGSIPPNTQIVLEVELLKSAAAPVPTEVAADKLTKTSTGLQYFDLKAGDGQEAVKNGSVTTGYTIWVKTDTGFNYINSSADSSPVNFIIGRRDAVFPGWDEGVTGMKVGGKRLLIIPPDLGLGSQASGPIPANSTLVMEVELQKASEPRAATKVDEKSYTTTASGLKYYDLVPGTGAAPTKGQTVVVNYTGWLQDGTQFDSSIDRGQPFSFVLGAGNVIPGWDEGVATMKVGGKRQLVIPPALAYGSSGAGNNIPPDSTLIFEVELLEIK